MLSFSKALRLFQFSKDFMPGGFHKKELFSCRKDFLSKRWEISFPSNERFPFRAMWWKSARNDRIAREDLMARERIRDEARHSNLGCGGKMMIIPKPCLDKGAPQPKSWFDQSSSFYQFKFQICNKLCDLHFPIADVFDNCVCVGQTSQPYLLPSASHASWEWDKELVINRLSESFSVSNPHHRWLT